MKDFIILIVAIFLFCCISIIGIPYTAIYYINNEKYKNRTYGYMLAFGIDIFGNISMGEFFEFFFAKKRGLTSFGKPTSISACIGELIVYNHFNEKYNWFINFLDNVFKEPNHCINAYMSEIL